MPYLYKYTVSVLIIHSLKRFNSYYHRQWLRTIAQQFTYKNDTERTEENKKESEWLSELKAIQSCQEFDIKKASSKRQKFHMQQKPS